MIASFSFFYNFKQCALNFYFFFANTTKIRTRKRGTTIASDNQGQGILANKMNIFKTRKIFTFTFGKSGNVAEILWDKQEILKRISNIRKNYIEKSRSYLNIELKTNVDDFRSYWMQLLLLLKGLVLKSSVAAELLVVRRVSKSGQSALHALPGSPLIFFSFQTLSILNNLKLPTDCLTSPAETWYHIF